MGSALSIILRLTVLYDTVAADIDDSLVSLLFISVIPTQI